MRKKTKNESTTSDSAVGLSDIVMLPEIKIDKDALRFSFVDGSARNLFWVNLFSPMRGQDFQDEILKNLFRAYNECVKAEDIEAT